MDILYNDLEPFACSWMRHLMFDGEIPAGQISKKSIKDIQPSEVSDFRQVHLFAGIGGWAEALRLANWPEDRQVWTGSCPCQPFSNAGKRKGTNDERHLWPEMRRLIAECRPSTIFGEQVASKSGRDWLAAVRSDLQAMGYAVGCADLCGASVGAPHIRQRLFWVANSNSTRPQGRPGTVSSELRQVGRSESCGVSAWSNVEYLNCKDGKARPVMPGVRLLANGFPNRVGLLRGFGNAIIPQVAAIFIRSFLETKDQTCPRSKLPY